MARDWNKEFQSILRQPDTLEKFMSLRTFAGDFIVRKQFQGWLSFVPEPAVTFKFVLWYILAEEEEDSEEE